MTELPAPLRALKDYPQFILWKVAQRDGKNVKLPVDVEGHLINAHDPANWMDAATALAYHELGFQIGFVFTKNDPFFFFDIDGALEGGKWSDLSHKIIGALPGAAVEVSQSGTGLHVFGAYTSVPEHASKNVPLHIELYTEGRFVALTFDRMSGSIASDCTEALATLAGYYFAPRGDDSPQEWTDKPVSGAAPIKDDEELLAKALDTRSAASVFGGKASFRDLFEANEIPLAKTYPDPNREYDASSADMAYAQHCAFWTGNDCERILRLMWRSDLVREKWNLRPDYVKQTILNATALQKTFYNAGRADNSIAGARGAPKLRANGEVRPDDSQVQENRGIEEIRSFRLSDRANAERLKKMYGDRLRNDRGIWYEWNLRRWEPNEKGAHLLAATVGELVRDEFRTNFSDDGGWKDPNLAKYYLGWAKQSESARGIKVTLDLAHSMPAFNGDNIMWDSDPWLFNAHNGTIDLRTGNLRSHRREDYITRICEVPYNPGAGAPRFKQFLCEIFDHDQALIQYVQWAVGYSLTALTRHHLFFVLWGGGANGKSTLVEVLKHVIGPDYFHTMTSDELLLSSYARHQSPIAQLEGKRFVVASETNESRRLNESLVKQLTGGDSIRANLMHRDAEEFRPVLKLWLMTNHRPEIRDDSKGMWRRIRLIPFTQTFEGAAANTDLAGELKTEAEGILAWAAEGAKQVQEGEPELPETVRAAVSEYKKEQDTLGQFLDEECRQGAALRAGKTDFYIAYDKWSKGRCGRRRDVTKRMRVRGFGEGSMHGGRATWLGLALIDHQPGGEVR